MLKNKGIGAAAVELCTQKGLVKDHYRSALLSDKQFYVQQSLITSKKHSITTKHSKKLALHNLDEKRRVLPDRITSIPFGYLGERYSEYQTNSDGEDV